VAILEYKDNLSLWLESDSLLGYTDDAEISSIVSKHNPNVVFSGGGAAANPHYRENDLCGWPTMHFEDHDWMDSDTTLSIHAANAGTIIVVAKPEEVDTDSGTIQTNDALIHAAGVSGYQTSPGIFLRNTSGVYTAYAFGHDVGGAKSAALVLNDFQELAWHIFCWRKGSANLWANVDEAYVKGTGACAALDSNLPYIVRIGRNNAGTAYFYGKIALILAYTTTLTDKQLAAVCAYPMAKYFSPSFYGSAFSPVLRGDGGEQALTVGSWYVDSRKSRLNGILYTGPKRLMDLELGTVVSVADRLGTGGGWTRDNPKAHVVVKVAQISENKAQLVLRPVS
jgi:hypothetical protein